MALLKIALKPGVFRDGTEYSAEGTWYDCDKIRFRKGQPEKIGGWQKYVAANYQGIARRLHDWATIGGARYIGVGTSLKLYVNEGSAYHDVTPIRTEDAITLGTDPIATTNGSGIITVTHTTHGAVVGDYVILSGATTTNGIDASSINTEHRIDSTPTANSFTVLVAEQATSTGSGGGPSVVSSPQINTGLDTFVPGSGWGAGPWGGGAWGAGATVGSANQLRLWSIDNFGDDMLANVRQGGVYYWDESNGTNTRAVALSELLRRSVTLTTDPLATENLSNVVTITDIGGSGAGVGDRVTITNAAATNGIPAGDINQTHVIQSTPTDTTFTILTATAATSTGVGGGSTVDVDYDAGEYYTPTAGLQVMVSNTARHVIVFGANAVGDPGNIDPLLVRWCSSENAADWNPSATNSAGFQRLSSGSQFVGAIRTRQEHIIWTDVGITSMRYSGSPFIFSFTEIARNVSMISANAAVNANGIVFFMDRGGFYTYTGAVKRLSCPIRDYVFTDLDLNQASKIVAGTNVDFSEVIWLYPSNDGGGEIDKYVKFNWDEVVWDFGTLGRACWSEAPTKTYPLASTVRTRSLGTDPISTTSGSPVITVTLADHGLVAGDEVILANVSSVGGLSTAVLNTSHTVVTMVDVNNFTLNVTDDASSTTTGGGTATIRLPNILYSHEVGHDEDGLPMNAFIESADFDAGDGDQFMFTYRLIPDIYFRENTDPNATVTLSLMGRDYPGDTSAIVATADVMPATKQVFWRARNRQWAIRAESNATGFGWRLGYPRLEVRPDGMR